MSEKTSYIVELTEQEAITLALLSQSGMSARDGFESTVIGDIGEALIAADPKLNQKQFSRWEELGCPTYSLSSEIYGGI